MRWYHPIVWFIGALFLANTVPHFVSGITGNAFQSPFATPPGEGLSSARTNIAWAALNGLIAWALLRIGPLDLKNPKHALPILVGFFGAAFLVAGHFARFHGGL